MFLADMPSSPQSIRSTHSGEFLGVGSKGAICGAIFNRRNCLMHILLGRRANCLRGGTISLESNYPCAESYIEFECNIRFLKMRYFGHLGLKRSANSCKRVVFAPRVQKKTIRCNVLKVAKRTLNVIQIISQFEMFFLRNFCQTYTLCRHQSHTGNTNFL